MQPEDASDQDARPRFDRSAQRRVRRRPQLSVPGDVLRRHGARVLDPDFAVALPGEAPPESTVYLPGAVKVTGLPGRSADARLAAVDEAARKLGYSAQFDEDDTDLARHVRGGPFEELVDRYWVCKVSFRPLGTDPVRSADSWKILQQVRADAKVPEGVELVHVMTACGNDFEGVPQYGGHGFEGYPQYGGHGTEGLPQYGGHGSEGQPQYGGHGGYGRPGFGLRSPVVVGLGDPRTGVPEAGRRPVVCVPDTGLGLHPWFKDHNGPREGVSELREYVGVRVGLDHDSATDPEVFGVGGAMFGLLDRDSGHGTFIAGLVRQYCPSADIVAIPVMASDGSADEDVLQRALVIVLLRHLEAVRAGRADGLVDVLSISMGYYHEKAEDRLQDAAFRPLFEEFGRAGVAVVCAAGNDGTVTPLYPAAWAAGTPDDTTRDTVPMVAVGASNPDGHSEALFSNVGPWVACLRPGVALISTMPTTFDAGLQPSISVRTPTGVRAGVDLDNFASGFAMWSGTSFSAPVLAGQLAARLAEDSRLTSFDPKVAVERAWAAVAAELDWERP